MDWYFIFFSKEHAPIHIHVKYAEYETVFELLFTDGVIYKLKKRKVKGKPHLPQNKLKVAEQFVEKYSLKIAEKWYDHFILGKHIKPVTIKTKLK